MKYTTEQLKPSPDTVYCSEKDDYFLIDPPNKVTTGLILCTGCNRSIYNGKHKDAYETN